MSLTLLACTDPPENEQLVVAHVAVPDTAVVVPEYPPARRGRLVAASTGQYDLNGTWEATAGRCDSLELLQILSAEPTSGTMILLRLPLDSLEGPYPIVVPAEGLGPAPSSQVAVQQHGDQGSRAFQADSGVVDLAAIGDRVTGRARVILREISNRDRIGYAAVFEAVPVTPMDSARCRLAGASAETAP